MNLAMNSDDMDYRLFQSHRYALVDAVWREDIPADWPQAVIAPDFLKDDTTRCPLLVDIGALPLETRGTLLGQLEEQVRTRENTLCSLLLASDAPLSTLARHLAARLALRRTGNDKPVQFRYFDPGTFLQLPELMGEGGMAWLLGSVTSVAVPWAGHWGRVVRPESAAAKAVTFALRSWHMQALLRLGAVNRVAFQMEAPARQRDWIARCKQITAHVLRAQQVHGLTAQEDLIAFADHALLHHPRFDEHERIKHVFAELSAVSPEDELDYRELSNRITPEEWQQLTLQLDSKTQPDNEASLASKMQRQGKMT